MAQPGPQIALLVYDAARELLSGSVGKEPPFHMTAYSGGSRGHQANVTPKEAADYLHSQAKTLPSRLATTPEMKAKGLHLAGSGPVRQAE